MSHFAVNPPSWWNSTGHQIPQFVSKSLSSKMESPAQLNHGGKQLGLQVQDEDSSSTQSAGQSHQEVTANGATNSQDQCISSESGQDESYGNHGEGQVKPVIFLRASDHVFNPSQVDYSHQMTHFPYPYTSPHFAGLMTAYGAQAIIQPQMMGIAPARVPLPLDLAEDGPMYVNAKQYNAILRRRQSRAKLEAQNKLVKSRKPYLHESRHIHALNRVRGSGGRFLSKNKLQQRDPTTSTTTGSSHLSNSVQMHKRADISEFDFDQSERNKSVASCADITSFSSNGVIFQQPDGRFSGIPSHMGGTMQGGGMCNGNQHRIPIVR